jgi:hypothetical protein
MRGGSNQTFLFLLRWNDSYSEKLKLDKEAVIRRLQKTCRALHVRYSNLRPHHVFIPDHCRIRSTDSKGDFHAAGMKLLLARRKVWWREIEEQGQY